MPCRGWAWLSKERESLSCELPCSLISLSPALRPLLRVSLWITEKSSQPPPNPPPTPPSTTWAPLVDWRAGSWSSYFKSIPGSVGEAEFSRTGLGGAGVSRCGGSSGLIALIWIIWGQWDGFLIKGWFLIGDCDVGFAERGDRAKAIFRKIYFRYWQLNWMHSIITSKGFEFLVLFLFWAECLYCFSSNMLDPRRL